MFDYYVLEKELKRRGIQRSDMGRELGLSSRTIAKIAKGEKLADRTIKRIAAYLQMTAEMLARECPDNPVLRQLRDEKEFGVSGGLYHELQIRMTYNSNHIEGSRLSEDQTRMIYETRTIDIGDGVAVDDILETVHHFRAIDVCIDRAEERLTEEFIKELHRILKQDTRDASLSWFAIGDYKKRANTVGGRATTNPSEVAEKMRELLQEYEKLEQITLEDIVAFHAAFEKIHPFQDGNGRVGRLIALKECLRHNIMPFIIEEHKKAYYYRGLAEWEYEPGYLIGTCQDGQDMMEILVQRHSL